jgi:hypothetical protein
MASSSENALRTKARRSMERNGEVIMKTLAHWKQHETRRFPALPANMAFAMIAAALLALSIIVLFAASAK